MLLVLPQNKWKASCPLWVFPVGVSVPCWGYKLRPSTALHFLRSAHKCPTRDQGLLCFTHNNVPSNLLRGEPSVISQTHTEGWAFKWWFLCFFVFFCLSITEAQDNEITHFLFSSWSIHLPRTIFSGHCVDYKFLIKLEERTQKIHWDDGREQPQGKLQDGCSQYFETREWPRIFMKL